MNENEKIVGGTGELDEVTNLLSGLEAHLYYVLDRVQEFDLKADDVRLVHALVNSALLKWNDIVNAKESAN